jgi:6-phosphogluconolactonase
MRGRLQVFPDVEALARSAADLICARAAASDGPFVVALSGGSTPKPVYENLAREPWRNSLPWSRVHWCLGDERFVPVTDPQSNFGMIRAALLDHVPAPAANIHPIQTEGTTPDGTAAAYGHTLEALRRPDGILFDINLLGMGDDGHTASLLPGEPVLSVTDRLAAPVPHGRENIRITLTYPALNASRLAVFLVAGAGKRAMLEKILAGEAAVPAAAVRPVGELLWFADRAAAGDRANQA